LKFDDQFMKNALVRINELQQEIIDKSKSIEGAGQYVEKKLELYDKDETLRRSFKRIHLEEQKIAKEFFSK